jgi:hypothetical protein
MSEEYRVGGHDQTVSAGLWADVWNAVDTQLYALEFSAKSGLCEIMALGKP